MLLALQDLMRPVQFERLNLFIKVCLRESTKDEDGLLLDSFKLLIHRPMWSMLACQRLLARGGSSHFGSHVLVVFLDDLCSILNILTVPITNIYFLWVART